jgi:DNA-binding transcriptional LysR family regulator
MISLHRLEGFYRVAKAGGYARAVADFPYPITQPAIHQQVRKLEQELGCRLLTRVAKDRMALTPAGRHLYEFCAPYFERLPRVIREAAEGNFAGTLRIDAGPQELRHVMPAWIQRLRRTQPHIRIELQEVLSVDAARLRTGRTDLVIEHWPNAPGDIEQRVVADARAYWAVPTALAPGNRVKLERLGDAPFIGFNEGSNEYAMQRAALEAFGLAPAHLLFASTADSILAFVQAGLGYSLVPWPTRTLPKLRGVIWRKLEAEHARFPIAASWLRGSGANALIKAALEAAPNIANGRVQ